jgi:hypothetical protein
MGVVKCFAETLIGIFIGSFLLLVAVQFSLLISNKDASKLDFVSQKVHKVLSSVKKLFTNPKIKLSEKIERPVENVKKETKLVVEETVPPTQIKKEKEEVREKLKNKETEKVGTIQKIEPKVDSPTKTEVLETKEIPKATPKTDSNLKN